MYARGYNINKTLVDMKVYIAEITKGDEDLETGTKIQIPEYKLDEVLRKGYEKYVWNRGFGATGGKTCYYPCKVYMELYMKIETKSLGESKLDHIVMESSRSDYDDDPYDYEHWA